MTLCYADVRCIVDIVVNRSNLFADAHQNDAIQCYNNNACLVYMTCGGFLSAELNGKLDALLRRLKRLATYGITSDFYSRIMLDKTDKDLFNNMCRSQRCLHHLLPHLRSV